MKKFILGMGMAVAGLTAGTMHAEESDCGLSLETGVDVVSSYIWRGQDCGGFSIQPAVTLSHEKSGLSLGLWASAELFESRAVANMSEFDWILSWSIKGLSIGLTDYYFCPDANYFKDWTLNSESSHTLEANLSYDFGPLALSWNTCLSGADHRYEDGELKRNYSTYVEVSAPWKLGGLEGSAAVGASLWNDAFVAVGNEKFNVCNISLTTTKTIKDIPVSATVVANPNADKVFFVIGVSF